MYTWCGSSILSVGTFSENPMSKRKNGRRKITLYDWLVVQIISKPNWYMTPERVVDAFRRSLPRRSATTGEATQALAKLVHLGQVFRSRIGRRDWWTWRDQN